MLVCESNVIERVCDFPRQSDPSSRETHGKFAVAHSPQARKYRAQIGSVVIRTPIRASMPFRLRFGRGTCVRGCCVVLVCFHALHLQTNLWSAARESKRLSSELNANHCVLVAAELHRHPAR